MSNIFGMDIRRFSVLFIVTIIILSIFASFRDLQNIQQNYNTAISTSTSTNLPENFTSNSYTYNKTITLNNSINDLRYVSASFTNVSPPNYTISSIPEFFNLSSRNASLLALFINYLSRNASMISPQAYGNLLSIGSSAYVEITSYRNTTLRPFPLNMNDTENYSKTMLIINYAKNFTIPSSFPSGWSYPPSDNISYHLVPKIVNTYSVTAYVVIKYSINYYLVNEYRTGYVSYYGGHNTNTEG